MTWLERLIYCAAIIILLTVIALVRQQNDSIEAKLAAADHRASLVVVPTGDGWRWPQ